LEGSAVSPLCEHEDPDECPQHGWRRKITTLHVELEAFKWKTMTMVDYDALCRWIETVPSTLELDERVKFMIPLLLINNETGGWVPVHPGDVIVRTTHNRFVPISAQAFQAIQIGIWMGEHTV
jgi:hypothetical protein